MIPSTWLKSIIGKKGSRCSNVKVKYKNWDTFAHLRASYIQCSPSKRTFTAKLLTARLLHITHVTGWEIICNFFRFKGQNDISAKEGQYFFFSILSRHEFHLYAWYCSNIYLVSLQRRKHFESLRIAWFPTRGLPLHHSREAGAAFLFSREHKWISFPPVVLPSETGNSGFSKLNKISGFLTVVFGCDINCLSSLKPPLF